MAPADKPHTITDVKQFRKDVDALIQRVDNVFGKSRELELVKTKLEEAKMWAGKELGNLGSELPPEFADKADNGDSAQGQDAQSDQGA